jgi:hypothetical protein
VNAAARPRVPVAGFALLLLGCGGDRAVVFPEVPATASEASCQELCTLAPGETICTAKHAEFCVVSCRARTRDLPAACAACLIAGGTAINGYTDSFGDTCDTGGPANIGSCVSACDDGGSAAPALDLEALCRLECGFYVSDHKVLACSADASGPCLDGCRAAIAARGRVCAQCMAEQQSHGKICLNDDCDCSSQPFSEAAFNCSSLCDATPAM